MFHVSAWQALGDMASFREHVSLSQNVLAVWGPFWFKLSQNSFLSYLCLGSGCLMFGHVFRTAAWATVPVDTPRNFRAFLEAAGRDAACSGHGAPIQCRHCVAQAL